MEVDHFQCGPLNTDVRNPYMMNSIYAEIKIVTSTFLLAEKIP
jgi:hypothetical protein